MLKIITFTVLLGFGAFAQVEPAPDPRVLQEEDIDKLTSVAADLISKCQDMKGKKTVTIRSVLNKTDEHLDKKKLSDSISANLKDIAKISTVKANAKTATLPALVLELTANKSLTGNLHKGTYYLKVHVFIEKDDACTVDSKFEKTGQI